MVLGLKGQVSVLVIVRTNKQTESQTDADERLTHAATVGVSKYYVSKKGNGQTSSFTNREARND